jgi:NADPH:quinone reductase-like Zn-dependent oxidoreductase
MKAIIQDEYGSADVLELQELDTPVPKDAEVLVRVHAAAVHPGDWMLMAGRPYIIRLGFGLRRPKKGIPGFDVAGRVETVGKDVTAFRPGDAVFGNGDGTCAEYVAAAEGALAPKPVAFSFEQAAAVPVTGLAALEALRDHARVRSGQKILINGTSGGVGTFAVQIGKALGAEVTGVCGGKNADTVRSLDADDVIDYTREDFTRGARRYDVILDNAGNHSLAACRRALAPGGTPIPNNGTSGGRWLGTVGRTLGALVMSPFVRGQGRPLVSIVKRDGLNALTELIEAGQLAPVIDRTFPLRKTAEAMRHVGEGHARGKVVITI